jgi:hypothetical protein
MDMVVAYALDYSNNNAAAYLLPSYVLPAKRLFCLSRYCSTWELLILLARIQGSKVPLYCGSSGFWIPVSVEGGGGAMRGEGRGRAGGFGRTPNRD